MAMEAMSMTTEEMSMATEVTERCSKVARIHLIRLGEVLTVKCRQLPPQMKREALAMWNEIIDDALEPFSERETFSGQKCWRGVFDYKSIVLCFKSLIVNLQYKRLHSNSGFGDSLNDEQQLYNDQNPRIPEVITTDEVIEIEDSEHEIAVPSDGIEGLSDRIETLSLYNAPSTIDDTKTTTTRSHERGVTYPESVMTGISFGEFMNP